MLAESLSRHKHALHWLHLVSVVGALTVVGPAIANIGEVSLRRALAIIVIATLAWCQNIGLLHFSAHHLPQGPRWLGVQVARFLHALGGLSLTNTRLAHLLHHAHLGTARDPDRLGYESTTTLARRMRYLLLIGPLRARFAPVDVDVALAAMTAERYATHTTQVHRDRRLVGLAHCLLLVLYGIYYPVVIAALLLANVFSNVREMAEHGLEGRGAQVDIRVSPLGLLLFSTPGFWFHGSHHIDPSLHYLDLPLIAGQLAPRGSLPYLHRSGAVRYLLTGH
jgi:fatty acid desaturase